LSPGHLREEVTVGCVDKQGRFSEKERGQYPCAKAAEDAVVARWLGVPVLDALLDVGLRLLGDEADDGHGEEQSPHVRVDLH
jgi:hypothetical protein